MKYRPPNEEELSAALNSAREQFEHDYPRGNWPDEEPEFREALMTDPELWEMHSWTGPGDQFSERPGYEDERTPAKEGGHQYANRPESAQEIVKRMIGG